MKGGGKEIGEGGRGVCLSLSLPLPHVLRLTTELLQFNRQQRVMNMIASLN